MSEDTPVVLFSTARNSKPLVKISLLSVKNYSILSDYSTMKNSIYRSMTLFI